MVSPSEGNEVRRDGRRESERVIVAAEAGEPGLPEPRTKRGVPCRRYIHLNPVRARLVEVPEAWAWSSYSGYADESRRLPWVAHERLWRAWAGEFGGDAATAPEAYRRFVAAGLERPPGSPFAALRHGWVLGSSAFEARLKGQLPSAPTPRATREARAVERDRPELSWSDVVGEVCAHYGLTPSDLARRGDQARPARGRRVAGPSLHAGAAPGSVPGAGVRPPCEYRGDPRPAGGLEGSRPRGGPGPGRDPGPAAGPPGSRVNPDPGGGPERRGSGRDVKMVGTRSLRDLYLYV